MPELPEVETVVRGLKELQGKTLSHYKLYKDAWRKPVPVQKLDNLIGKKIKGVKRRAKWPAIIFEEGCLWLHLGMTGQLRLFDEGEIAPDKDKNDHLELYFTDNTMLRFRDPRRFGIVAWTEGESSEPPSSQKIGYEPFDPLWTAKQFHKDLQEQKKNIKVILMDGKLVAGVGNIYACEALFASKISPLRDCKAISLIDASLLRNNIIHILSEGIRMGGSTLQDHRTAKGEIGEYQKSHKVYGKEKETCPSCHSQAIEKIQQAGRSTFYCPHCQK